MVCEIAVVWPAQAVPGTCAKAILRICALSLCVDRPQGTSQAGDTAEHATCRLARSGFTVEPLAQRDRRPVLELRIDGGSAPATASVMGATRYAGVRAVYSICRRTGCDQTQNEPGPAPAAQRRLRRWCESQPWSGRLRPCLIREPRPSCTLFPCVGRPHSTSHAECTAEHATVAGPSAGGPTTAGPMMCEMAVVWSAQAVPGTCAKTILRSCTLSLCVDRPHSTSHAEGTAEQATDGSTGPRRWANDGWADGVRDGGGLVSSGGG